MGPKAAVIVVAAGKGTRFLGAEHKLAQPIDGLTVLGLTLQHAIESELRVVVVTTERLAGLARRSVAARDVVVLPEVGSESRDRLGMGTSIAAGVAACPEAGGWLVLPGDMPQVQSSTIQAVAAQLEHQPIVFAQHRGRRGHPVGFGAELYSELVALSGDEGARRLVARYPAHGIELDDPGVLVDVDTLADLDAVRRARAERTVTVPRG